MTRRYVRFRVAPIVDPRERFRGAQAVLAPRLVSLKDKRILLLDNSQLTAEAASYGPVFRWLADSLQRDHGVRCVQSARNLLKGSREDLASFAAEIAGTNVDGVIVALCHAGVTQPSTILASELERLGKPCVLLCTSLGLPLASVTASSYAPGLPLALVGRASGSSDTFGQSEARNVVPDVVSGLTLDSGELLRRFKARFGAPVSPAGREGGPKGRVRVVVRERDGVLEGRLDPGRFADDLYEKLCALDMCDGFPVVPPTQGRVRATLRYTDLDPDHALVNECPPSGAPVTVRALAANAVMAGCRPEYFPILVAAMRAMADGAYRLFQSAITTHPGGNAIVVSGPLAEELGIHSGQGCLGPGFRANATIGRAITLALINIARAIPGKSDLAVFGSAAKFTYCVAENERANPWTSLHADLYGPEATSVTVHKCEVPRNVNLPLGGGPEALLTAIASTSTAPGVSGTPYVGEMLVLLNADHARMIADAGWSKQDVKEYLFETARHLIDGIDPRDWHSRWPPYTAKIPRQPVLRGPEDILVVVCGGQGPQSMVAAPWGLSRAVSRPVASKDGTPLRSIREVRPRRR